METSGMSSLAARIEDIPGVAAVVVDFTDSGGGINLRLETGADEAMVMEKVRGLLAAYGAKAPDAPGWELGQAPALDSSRDLGVDVAITPIASGARVEVASAKVRSFRVVTPEPIAIAQGLSDAWCQVIGRAPVEIVRVTRDRGGRLEVMASDGQTERVGIGDVTLGFEQALTTAVGGALGAVLRADGPSLVVR